MSDPIFSPEQFKWFLTILTGGFAGTWFFYDAYSLIRLPSRNERDPQIAHDKRFGYIIGMAIGFVGVWGCLRFHGVA